MQKYKEINGNDYVKDSRTTINETMQSIQSMNSGTAFPTNNLFEGMKCYRTDLKKTYTLKDVENNTWVEDAHATLSDEATHAASATKLDTARSLNLGGAVTADAATFDGTANATINVKTLDATKLKGTASVSTTGNAATATKLQTPRTLSLTGNASGSANFDGSGNVSISTTVNESKHAAAADTLKSSAATETSTVARPVWLSWEGDNTKQTVSPNLTYTCSTKTLTAANFKGHLAGNADTATTANTAMKVNATAPNGGAADLVFGTMAVNDYARIRVGGSDDNGWLEIATADGSNEPIYVRQYGGPYDWPNGRPGTVTNEAALLDSNGNTKFPKNVTAASFTGPLKGNADTASKLSTARKINITGNASGSANFDGTSDVSINVSVSQAAHADKATQDTNGRAFTDTNAYMHISALADNTDFNNVKTTGIYYCTGNTYSNRPHNSWGILTVYSIGTVKQEYRPDNAAVYYTREYNNKNWTEWSKVAASTADSATNADTATTANAINNLGGKTAIKDGTREPLNLSLYQVYNNGYPASYGNLLSIGGGGGGELLAEWSGADKGIGHLYYRNRRDAGNLWSDWRTVAFTSDINSFAPTKTGGGASGTWGINISGNANTASTASSVAWSGVTGKPGTYPPSAHNHDSAYPSVTGTRASGTWGINISGNANTATNADKLDGYHASDIINKISAANTGGIVAASLTENGYVKFANGLILQWGKVPNVGTHQISFPIAFLNGPLAFAGISIRDGEDTGSWRVRTYTTTNFTYYAANKDYGSYIVVGT